MKNLKELTNELSNRVEEATTKKELWEQVERVSKKDGADFSALSKNFKNANVRDYQYSLRPNKEIYVCGRTSTGKWVEDNVKQTDLVKYAKRKIDPSRAIKESYLEPYYYLTVDEIFEEINAKIEYYTNRIEELNKQINGAEKAFAIISEKCDELTEILNNINNEQGKDLYYQLRECIAKRF